MLEIAADLPVRERRGPPWGRTAADALDQVGGALRAFDR